MTDKNSIEAISIEMNWQQAAVIIAAVLESGTEKGKDAARQELLHMALVADSALELQEELESLKFAREHNMI